jgi:hypothetical protein
MLVIGAYNQADTASLSGGTWNASYPLANVKTRYLYQQARSTTNTAVVIVDLGTPMNIGCCGVIATNATTSTYLTIEASDTLAFTIVRYTSGSIQGYGGTDIAKSFTEQAYRYWRFTVTDANLSYISIGRIFVGRAIRFATNVEYGCSFGIESTTVVTPALSGTEYFEEHDNRRVTSVKFSWLTDSEALSTMLPLLRSHDISKEVYLVFDDEDTIYRATRNYLARLKQVDALSNPYIGVNSVGLQLIEII